MERERDGWRVKKRAGRSCLLNHITIKGIALTLSPHCALSIPTNLLIDRRSSQTVPSSPPSQGPRGSLGMSLSPHRPPSGAPTTTDYSGCRRTRICYVNLKTRCSVCEYTMKQGGEHAVFCVGLFACAVHAVAERIQEEQLQVDYWTKLLNTASGSS